MINDPTGWTKLLITLGIILAAYFYSGANNYKEPKKEYTSSNVSFETVDQEVGCSSKYSDDKKKDIFNSEYRNHWMVWSGEVVLSSADDVSLNINGKGTQDLMVKFENKNAGYDLTKGSKVTVKFLMKSSGGCFLPFGGELGILY